MSSKLSPRQKQKLFRYAQYAILAVIALAAILLADWKTLSQQVFNLDVAAKQFPDVITVALKNTLLYTGAGLCCGPLRRSTAGAHAYFLHCPVPLDCHPVR